MGDGDADPTTGAPADWGGGAGAGEPADGGGRREAGAPADRSVDEPAAPTDSGGGRRAGAPAAPDVDEGASDPALAAALSAWAVAPIPDAETAVRAALLGARLLVPLVALPVEEGGSRGEMARPTLLGRDGRPAVPVFSSLDALTRWRPDARPVPMAAAHVFTAAVEANEAVVLDVAGPVPFAVEGTALRALAAGIATGIGPSGGSGPSGELGAPVDGATQPLEGGLSVIEPAVDPSARLREDIAEALAREPLVVEAYLLAPEGGSKAGSGASPAADWDAGTSAATPAATPAVADVSRDVSDAAVGLVLGDDVTPAELVAIVQRLAETLGPSPGVARGLDIAVLTSAQRAAARSFGPPLYVARQDV